MADKKISELPLITTISGSIVFVPIVHDGITEKITVEDFSKFTNKYAAQTGSANTFTANQTITANLSVSGTSTLTGNTSIGGNLVVNGKLTAQEVHTEITSASIIFESGSTIFGNTSDDTHQFTGIVSINGTTIGAQALNDFTASTNNQLEKVYQTTSSLNIQTGSQHNLNAQIGIATASLNFATSSLNTQTGSQSNLNAQIGIATASLNFTTGALNAFTGSVIGQVNTISTFTSSVNFTTQSLNTQTGSQDSLNAQIGIATGSLNAFTGSVIGQTNTISTFTASVNFTTQSLNTQTGSQNIINFNISVVTSSIDAHILKQATQTGSQDLINYNISVVTSSINAHILKQATQTGSQDLVNYNISVVTSSIDSHILKQATQTGSQDLVNYQNSIITSSYRIELNSIEAYTSSLKNAIIINGSNVQIVGELDVARLNVQYVSSSVLVTSGSNTFGDQSTDKHEFTGSVAVSGKLYVNDSATNFLIEGNGFSQTYLTSNGAMVLNPGFGGVEMVGSYRTFKATDITADGFVSGEIRATNNVVSSSTQIQNYDVFALNSNLYNGTGSIKAEIAGIEAYTASLKAAAIVSSSQQIKDYITFVNNDITSSMNVNSASIAYKATNVVGAGNRILFNNATDTTTTSAQLQWDGSKLAVNGNIAFGYASTLQSSNDPTNNISLHDGTFGIMAFRNGGTDRITLYRTTDTVKISGSLVVDANSLTAKHQITGSVNVTGSLSVDGEVSSKTLYVGGATTSTGLIGASEAVVQNELGIQYGDATGTYMRLIANGANSNTAIQVGAFSGADPSLDLIAAGGSTAISIKSDAGVNFGGNITGSGNLTAAKVAIGSTVKPTIPLEVYGQQKWFTTTGDGSELRGLFNPGGAADDSQLTLYKADGTTAGITLTPDGINFSANANTAGMTSELLNDYEEGTFTPTFTGVNLTITNYGNRTGHYTKVGRLVTVTIHIMTEGVSAVGSESVKIGGLPFTAANIADTSNAANIFNSARWNANPPICAEVGLNSTEINLYSDRGATGAGTDPTTAKSGDMAIGTGNRNMVRLTATYFV